MMNDSRILFFDSGIGGLPYLEAVRKLMPGESYDYIADRDFFPYGTKSIETVGQRVLSVVSHMVEFSRPKLCVIACNTATISAIALLRQNFDIPFVGVVPAVKPACKQAEKIAVLATGATVADGYIDLLIDKFGLGREVIRMDGNVLATFVEKRFLQADEKVILEVITPYTEACRMQGIQALVLGCTHFLHLAPWFRKLLPESTLLVDSLDGVAKRTHELVAGIGYSAGARPSRLYCTGGIEANDSYGEWAKRFDLQWSGGRTLC